MWHRAACLAATVFLACAVGSPPAVGWGAIADGVPADVSRSGLALGVSWNYVSRSEAEANALKKCLAYRDAPPDTRALCKISTTFEKACVAVSIDPKPGTPGWGWAVRSTRQDAEASAVRNCRKIAGPDRQFACGLTLSECDTR